MAFQRPEAQQQGKCKESSEMDDLSHSLLRCKAKKMEDQRETRCSWDRIPVRSVTRVWLNSSAGFQKQQ